MDSFDDLIKAVRQCSPEQKQQIFSELRDSVLIHSLEKDLNVRAEVILEAINRSNDLTQRGIRGVIAETVFVVDVMPSAFGWTSNPPIGDVSYDACLEKGERRIRIQVKTQRRKEGKPMRTRGSYMVETQRTRTGKKNGVDTRPYRFTDFDMLAVCMWASTGNWHSFIYTSASNLKPAKADQTLMEKLQPIPDFDNADDHVWSRDLLVALERHRPTQST